MEPDTSSAWSVALDGARHVIALAWSVALEQAPLSLSVRERVQPILAMMTGDAGIPEVL